MDERVMGEAQPLVYHIYGRKAYQEPLAFVQAVAVPAGQPIPPPEGEDWIEVVAFPAEAAIRVIPWEQESKA